MQKLSTTCNIMQCCVWDIRSARFVFFCEKRIENRTGNETVVECLTMIEWDLIGYGQLFWLVIVWWLLFAALFIQSKCVIELALICTHIPCTVCTKMQTYKMTHIATWEGFVFHKSLKSSPMSEIGSIPLPFALGIPCAAVQCIMRFTCISFHVGQGRGVL